MGCMMGSIKVVEIAGLKLGFWNRWDTAKHVRLTEILIARGLVAKHILQRELALSNRMELDGIIAELNVLALELKQKRAIIETEEDGSMLHVRVDGRRVQAVKWNQALEGK